MNIIYFYFWCVKRFISQHYGVDLSAAPDDVECDDVRDTNEDVRRPRRPLSIRKAIDELTQLRLVSLHH